MSYSKVSTASPSCSHGAVPPCRVTDRQKRLDTARRLQQLIYLAFLVVLATASAQTGTWQLNPNEPLEKYDMPPAPPGTYRLESSPRMISPYGYFVSYQGKVVANGNNTVGKTANQPTIQVENTNHSKITISWRQFNTVQSSFRKVGWGYTTV